jgi:hypothetical protein
MTKNFDSNCMANVHSKAVSSMTGEVGKTTTYLHFKDGSRLIFEMNAAHPNPRTEGGDKSLAHAFASDVRSFNIKLPRTIIFTFKDDSQLSYEAP